MMVHARQTMIASQTHADTQVLVQKLHLYVVPREALEALQHMLGMGGKTRKPDNSVWTENLGPNVELTHSFAPPINVLMGGVYKSIDMEIMFCAICVPTFV